MLTSDVIIAEGLTRFYGKLCAVDNVSFSVHKGELFALLGPNGAGKTTTIRMLTTALKLDKGSATVCGFNVTTHAHEIREKIAIVQQRNALDMFLSVQDNLEIYGKLHDIPSMEIKDKVNWALDQFDLRDHRKKPISELSGGLMRRVQVARVFMCKPEIMFLDEPTSGLDPQSRRSTLSLIESVAKKNETTIFLTTQSMEEAESLSERVAIMDHGRILVIDTPSNLKRTIGGNSVIEVRIQNPNQKVVNILRDREGLDSVHVSGNTLIISVRDSNEGLPKIVETLISEGTRILSIDLHEPSLEDVFLTITGKKVGV